MHAHILPHSVSLEDPLLGRDAVYMYSTITALGGDKLIHRIPCNALHIMVMFCKLSDAGPVRNTENTCCIVCAAGNYVFPCWAPSEIIDFVCRATA